MDHIKKYFVIIGLVSISFVNADTPVRKHFRYAKTVENAFVNGAGIYNGKFDRVYDGHTVDEGQYDDGLRTGVWKSTNLEGRVVKQVSYKNDLLDGTVSLFFADGKPRVTGAFIDGLKDGPWNYYNDKGKVIKTGLFDKGAPKGVWVLFDDEGDKVVEKYDFDAKKSLIDNRTALRFTDEEIKFKSSYMTKSYRYREVIDVPPAGLRPLGGYRKTKELFAKNFDIPQDIWFTYLAQTYFTSFKVLANGAFGDITVTRIKKPYLQYKTGMDFYFFTEYNNNLQRVNVEERSLFYFAEKVKEDFQIFYGPWIVEGHDPVIGSMQMNFVVNQE